MRPQPASEREAEREVQGYCDDQADAAEVADVPAERFEDRPVDELGAGEVAVLRRPPSVRQEIEALVGQIQSGARVEPAAHGPYRQPRGADQRADQRRKVGRDRGTRGCIGRAFGFGAFGFGAFGFGAFGFGGHEIQPTAARRRGGGGHSPVG